MTITTSNPPEAELEARLTKTLERIFVGTTDLLPQRRFKLRLGHKQFDAGRDYIEGRADVLVMQGGKPLAVLELKREGLALTSDDEEQGRSYALLAQAPLVVVTNGLDTRLYQAHDMSRIDGTSIEASNLVHRVNTAALAAQSHVNGAIHKLLGTDLASEAIAAINDAELSDLSGPWASEERFVQDFLVPRKATEHVRAALRGGTKQVVIVSGPPLTGKSNVIRELVLQPIEGQWDVLFLDGSSCSDGLFRRLANVLSAQFGWSASPDEARAWLRQITTRGDRKLVICIDSLPAQKAVLVSELDELVASGTGVRPYVVLAIDLAEVESLTLAPNRRDRTRLGRRSEVVEVGHYDDAEFALASRKLAELRGVWVFGAQYALELRAPWVLRAAIARKMSNIPEDRVVVLPPLLGKEMFAVAAARFTALGECYADVEKLARIYIDRLEAKMDAGDRLGRVPFRGVSPQPGQS